MDCAPRGAKALADAHALAAVHAIGGQVPVQLGQLACAHDNDVAVPLVAARIPDVHDATRHGGADSQVAQDPNVEARVLSARRHDRTAR